MRLGFVGFLMIASSLAGAASAGSGGLNGDEVRVDLLTESSGGFSVPTAIVGPGMEFTRDFNYALIGVDVSDFGFTLSYVGQDGADGFNLGLLGFELSSLDFASGEVIVDVQELTSTWPANTFDDVSFGPDTISIDMSQPNITISDGQAFVATFAITTPEPAAGTAAAFAALLLIGSRRRYSRSGGVTRAIQRA